MTQPVLPLTSSRDRARRTTRGARPRTRSGARTRTAPRHGARAYHQSAQRRLRRFRQGTALAVSLTAFLLLLWGAPLDVEGQEPARIAAAAGQPVPPPSEAPAASATAAVDEATSTIRELASSFYAFLPRLVLVLLLLGLAALAAKLARIVLERSLGRWERAAAATAVTRLVVFVTAGIAAISVLAGDVRAVVGSVGLLGLAASWALQTPIESFTGWLLNAFRGYYRVGDRIAVGDVFGDVYRIDLLTTTVWEAGGPGKPVTAAQSTGAMITFPNWEVLRSNVVNYTRDFPYVWDEVTVNVANESDLGYCVEVLQAAAKRVLGEQMKEPARQYEQLLESERLTFDVDEVPTVYLSGADSWTACTIRYLVAVRSRRRWSSALILETSRELAKPEHRGRILAVYPRTETLIHRAWPSHGDDVTPREETS